ncbi:hypothetical protein QTJ16_006201 [Diplocarpon rosae]|uniref:Ubiquitin-conjugating enzyme E2-binding protein n=1 Tax=Diplocarpon rosae TaxID=946125 RepID=A0AAD9SV95_9HELO|nr:hypothetical protein QTJ16_006201 [Diplocarpon rosae]
MSSSAPLIYAELLSNIRQVSVIVALCEPCDSATKVELSENGKQFLLRHRGQLITLGLPSQAISGFQLQKPILGNKELSWRLPLAGQASRASIEGAQSNEVPWSAKDLPSDAEFTCRRCRAIIIEKGTIKVWKDLPSENWAEMMDFWHCHKPDIPASEKEADGSSSYRSYDAEKVAASKGYGASTRFLASSGIALIDITTFVLYPADCKNLTSSSLASATPTLAMKVFWRLVSTEEAAVLMDSDSVESIELPTEGILEIEGDLRESALWLPSSARKFKEWDVGLLARYQPKP